MENDSIYPNFGEPFLPTPPPAQKEAEDIKKQATLNQLPLLKEEIDRLNQQIAFYDSPKAYPDHLFIHPIRFMHVVAINKGIVAILENERNFILARVNTSKE